MNSGLTTYCPLPLRRVHFKPCWDVVKHCRVLLSSILKVNVSVMCRLLIQSPMNVHAISSVTTPIFRHHGLKNSPMISPEACPFIYCFSATYSCSFSFQWIPRLPTLSFNSIQASSDIKFSDINSKSTPRSCGIKWRIIRQACSRM